MAVDVDLHGLPITTGLLHHPLDGGAVHLATGAQPAQAELPAEPVAFVAAILVSGRRASSRGCPRCGW